METNSITLTRKELYDLVWSNSILTLSKRFAVSDNGLRKICKRMNVPLPGNGHWMKIQFNKKVKITPFQVDINVDQTVVLDIHKEGEIITNDPVKKLAKEIKINTAERLHSPHALVVQAKQILTAKDKIIHHGTLRIYRDALDIHVSRAGVPRALLLMDVLIKALLVRKHGIIFKNGETYATVKGQELQIKLREQTKRVKGQNSWAEYVPTGIFYFKVDRYPGKEFRDGSRKLEEKIAEVIAWLEIQADKDNARDEKWRIEREAEKLEKERLREIAADWEREMERYRELVKEAERWKQAAVIREYVAAVEHAGKVSGEDTVAGPIARLPVSLSNETETKHSQDLELWVEWARKKADWVDSVVQGTDEVLGRYGEAGK